MGFLQTLCFLASIRGDVLGGLFIEPPIRVRVESGTLVNFTCLVIGSNQYIASCRWVFLNSDSQQLSIFVAGNQTKDLDPVVPAPEVALAENGMACRLRLPAVGPGSTGWYFCADWEAGFTSDVAVLGIENPPGTESGVAGQDNSTSYPEVEDRGDSSCKNRREPLLHIVIPSVVGAVLVILGVLLTGTTCRYRRELRRIRQEESKLDLDKIRIQSQVAVLQKETEFHAPWRRSEEREHRYLPS